MTEDKTSPLAGRVVLITGDGDFVQVVRALQNMGCRVELVAFQNVSYDLRCEADLFIPGFLIPGLLPQQPSIDRTEGYTFHVTWNAAPEIELRSITAWRSVSATQWDNAGGAHRVPLVRPGCTGTGCNFSRYSLADLFQTQFSQEFQAVGTFGQIDYVLGLFYYNEHVRDDAATPNSLVWPTFLLRLTTANPSTSRACPAAGKPCALRAARC